MEQKSHAEDEFEHLDADAVCEQCSTVNPAGTLLCKTCGNNLRDQRDRRLSKEGAEFTGDTGRPRRVLLGLLTVFGLLAISWTVINVFNGNIEAWLTEGLTSAPLTSDHTDPTQFFSGSEAGVYDAMARELEQNPVTADDAARAQGTGMKRDTFDGRYAIMIERDAGSPVHGGALVRTEGNDFYFVAHLGRNTEIRGKATRVSDYQFDAEQVGVRIGSDIRDAYGYARLQPDGSLLCTGALADVETPFSATVTSVP